MEGGGYIWANNVTYLEKAKDSSNAIDAVSPNNRGGLLVETK